MHFAAVLSDRCLKELIKHPNVDLNSVTFVNYTPLHIAIHNEKVPQTQTLLEIDDVDLNTIKNKNGFSVVQAAVIDDDYYYKIDCLKLLTEHEGANFNICDDYGDTPIMWTLKKNKIDRFEVLINCPRVDINLKDSGGDTIAMWAMKNGKLKAVKTILSRPSIDINSSDSNEDTIAFLALKKGHTQLFPDIFTNPDLDFLKKDGYGDTVVSCALRSHPEALSIIFQIDKFVSNNNEDEKSSQDFSDNRKKIRLDQLREISRIFSLLNLTKLRRIFHPHCY